LYFETPTMHLHICGVLFLDPSTCPNGWTATSLAEVFRARMELLLPMRRKVSSATLRLHHPVWVDVREVDLTKHLSRVACPAPGDRAALEQVVGEFAGKQLSRDKPLWEALEITGLQDGRIAVVLKVHHCAVDGVGAATVLGNLLDLSAEGRSEEELDQARALVESSREPEPSLVPLAWHTAMQLAKQPVRSFRFLGTLVSAVTGIVRSSQDEDAPKGGAVPFASPRASFNGAISGERVVAFAEVSLAELQVIRHYLLSRGELPETSLVGVVPSSTKGTSTQPGNNNISGMFTTLATDIADPVERLRVVQLANDAGKASAAALGDGLMPQVAEMLPPAFNLLARAYSAMRLADAHPVPLNVVVSNIPGPPLQLYFNGAAVTALYPLGPVIEGPALNITVASYNGNVGFGFIAAANRMPDAAALAEAVRPAVDELLAAIGKS
jgi:diacylglycerol O-acyltransferase